MYEFWSRGGYDHTSISDLTAAMGISSPSLYAAFGGKRGLFDEAVAMYESRPAAPATRAVAAPTSHDVVERMLTAAAREYTDAGHPRGCLVMADPQLAQRRNDGRAFIADRLRDSADSGDLPDSLDPEDLAEFLIVMLNGMAARARDGVDHERLSAVADIAVRCLRS